MTVKTKSAKETKKVVKEVKKTAKAIKEVKRESIVTPVASKALELNEQVAVLKVTKTAIKKQTPSEILEAIKLVGQIQALEKELGDAKNALKDSIKNIMKNTKMEEIVSGEFKASCSEYTSDSFDTTLFKKEKPKMYEKYLKTTNKTRFSVDTAKAGK